MTKLDDLYKVWNDHDVEGILSFFHDGLVYTDKCINTVFNGPEELKQFIAGTFVAIPDLNFEVLSSFETDTRVAGEALMKGTFKEDLGPIPATGKEFVINYAIVGTVEDGKIKTLTDYWNFNEFVGA